jgi:hypothetical protein
LRGEEEFECDFAGSRGVVEDGVRFIGWGGDTANVSGEGFWGGSVVR